MRDVTATEAARAFSDLLDAVEHRGERFAIIRRGKVIAQLIPVGKGSGREIKALLAEFPPDPFWAADLAAIRSAVVLEERP